MINILLPTDFSENSWNAIEYALNYFKSQPCNFYLLHVNRLTNVTVNDSPYAVSRETIENIYTKPAKEKLRKLLKRIIDKFQKNDNHRFYTQADYNFFIESIRENVERKNIDLIVMGTKGASGLKQYIVGSNTGDVITKVKCNTLVIPENAKFVSLKEIAFPTDFSITYDLQILEPIIHILKSSDLYLRILHIIKKNSKLSTEEKVNKELLEDYFHNHKHSFHFLTNSKVEDALQCFVESRNINMIIMVAKNLNYFQQILFHSRVEKISYHIEIPFLVLHE